MDVVKYLKEVVTPNWSRRIKYGVELNLPIGVEIGKTDFEALSCIQFGIKGTGKSSGDNDHDNGDETKGANKIRPKECACGRTCHYFQETCECGSKEFKYSDDHDNHDVRWGIDSKAHFRYGVPNYHLWILEAQEYTIENRTFILKLYTISGQNRVFQDILRVQSQSSSKHKNFLPYSGDFYASDPKLLANYKITISLESDDVEVSSEEVSEVVLTRNILTKSRGIKKYLPKSFVPTKDTYLYEEIESYLNVNEYKTSHGKSRGKTRRRSQPNL